MVRKRLGHEALAAGLVLFALLAVSCSGGDLALPNDAEPDRLELIDGDGQVGRPGERLPERLVVQLVNEAGQGLPGRAITWIVSEGGGRTQPSSDSTDAGGFARAEWILGPDVGVNTVDAVVSRVGLVTFTATAGEDEPSELAIEAIEGDDQTAPVGAAVPVRPAVRVTRDGAPAAGVAVTFAVLEGGGRVEDAAQTTNADGMARAGDWVLGAAPGTNRLEAIAEGLEDRPVVFAAEATAGSGVDRLEFQVEPPTAVDARERFRVEVALVDESGTVVPLSGIVIYLGLFQGDNEVPSNSLLLGDRFRETESGVAVFDDIGITEPGRYRLRALTDDLPEYGQGGPQPPRFSDQFEVD
jgi:hypothetical protein